MASRTLVKTALLTLAGSLIGFVNPLEAQEATFTDLFDLVPGRCFSAPLTVVDDTAVDIGIDSGYDSATWRNRAFVASTTPFNSRTANDTFTVTATAPPGMRITRVRYQQIGSRYLERSTYWTANGSGTLTVDGVPQSFHFTTPSLTRSVDLSGQNQDTVTISVQVSIAAARSANFPRVTAPPGSATISITNAVISVEYDRVLGRRALIPQN
jgi:hypothetical protein